MPFRRPDRRIRRVSLADRVADAMLVARAGVRQQVKNVVILRALRDGADFDEGWYADAVRTELEAVAAETEADAARVTRELDFARGRHLRAATARDFVDRDVPTLKLRRKVLRALAVELRALAADDEAVASLIVEARAGALDEIAATAAAIPGRGRTKPLKGLARSRALQSLREELRDYLDD
ncbi:hypothetical protein [Protaetiibacter intestinalis]|uniref:Asparagine synthase n=1 Tax=Protaetiibacter intestinalis TaxID=2419774 RepID=A0A387B9B2_9MICO|nr:hypothetical protein [Protaetiibacter intestinalis]AYF97686.1 hypothetical protein D7I47_05070 [Protaetiibacter intestinalis]